MLFEIAMTMLAFLIWGAVYVGGLAGAFEEDAAAGGVDPEEDDELLGMKCVCGVDGAPPRESRDGEGREVA